MRNLVAFICALTFFTEINAQVNPEAQYWVIGSYNILKWATLERARIEALTGYAVEIIDSDHRSRYRLVIRKRSSPRQKQRLNQLVRRPWTLPSASVTSPAGQQDGSYKAYYIVLAGFRSRTLAEQFVRTLRSNLSDYISAESIMVDSTVIDGFDYHRVIQGPYSHMPQTTKVEFVEMGFHRPWWLEKYMPAPRQQEREVPARFEAPQVAASKMSYVEYCLMQISHEERIEHCFNGEFQVQTMARVLQSLTATEYALFCSRSASLDERRQFCDVQSFKDRQAMTIVLLCENTKRKRRSRGMRSCKRLGAS